MSNMDLFLHSFLVESSFLTESEFSSLTEESKIETIKDIASTILKTVNEKLSKIETGLIDRSKGDIKQFRDLDSISKCLNTLQGLMDKAATPIDPRLLENITAISKSILYLNQYSMQFKDAYRNKKILLILKYQSIILSVVSAVSYLISVMVDFSDENVKLSINPKFEEIAPFTTLKNFVKSVESGEFRIILRDVQVMRESFNENPKALDEDVFSVIDTVTNGIKNFYSSLDNGGKTTQIIYKVIGVVALIFSLREIFYMLGNMRTKFSDVLDNLKNFSGISISGSGLLNKLNTFSNKFKVESEFGTEMAHREIASEDREISSVINSSSIRSYKPEESLTSDDSKANFGGFFDF